MLSGKTMLPTDTQSAGKIVFGPFELNIQTAELYKKGHKLQLSGRSAQLLVILAQQAGHLVSREHLRLTLWPQDTYVDFDHGLNNCISRIRQVLGDSVELPRYIDTLPKQGYRFIGEVRVSEPAQTFPADNLAEMPVGPPVPLSVDSETSLPNPPEEKPSQRSWLWALSAVAAVVASAAMASFLLRSSPVPPVVEGVSQITDDGNPKSITGLVSDGSRVYFNEIRDGTQVLAQVATTGGESGLITQNIPGSELAGIASDPSRLLVISSDLWVLPLPAGEPRRLPVYFDKNHPGDRLAGADAGSFPDGRIAFTSYASLYLTERDGSNPRKLFDFQSVASNPVVSPDGKKIRLSVLHRRSPIREIWELNSDGSGAHPLLKNWQNHFDSCCGRWTADGKRFVFQSRREGRTDLWVLPEEKRWFGGEPSPMRLTNGPLSYELPYPSADGKHIYVIGRKQRGELVRFDRNSQQFVPFLSGISATDLTVSRDGKWIAYESYPDHSLWRSRVDGSERLQLIYPPAHIFYPRISPDGTKVAYGSLDANGNVGAYVVSLDGGMPWKIVDHAVNGVNWSPDSNSVVADITAAAGFPHVVVQTTDLRTGKNNLIPDSAGKGGVWWPSQNMLVAPNCSGGGECEFVTFDFTTQKWSHLVKGPFDHWTPSADGEYLYYTTGNIDPKLMRIRFSNHKLEEVTSLKNFRRIEDEVTQSWIGVTPDRSPLLTRDIGTDEIYDISLRWH